MTIAIIVTIGASITASGVVVAYQVLRPSDTILRGVFVAGIHVGQLTTDRARQHIEDYVQSFADFPLSVHLAGQEWEFPARELGVNIRLDDMLEHAFAMGRHGPFWEQVVRRIRLTRNGVAIPVLIGVDE